MRVEAKFMIETYPIDGATYACEMGLVVDELSASTPLALTLYPEGGEDNPHIRLLHDLQSGGITLAIWKESNKVNEKPDHVIELITPIKPVCALEKVEND